MAFCVLAKENPFGDLVVLEGEFIRTFLKNTPADYVKLYVFCQYALNNHVRCNTISELAVECALSVDTVKAGLDYFSKEELLRVVSQSPLAIEIRSVKDAANKKNSELPEIMSGCSDYFAALRSVIGRDLKPSEMEKAREWVDIYKMPESVVILMVQHCMQNLNKSNKKSRNIFAYFDKTVGAWVENGIVTDEDAELYINTYELEHHVVNDVMLHIGIRRMPSIEEVKLYEKWTKQWSMSHEAIIAACAETTKVANPSFAYLDKIIECIYQNLNNGDSAYDLLDAAREKRQEANNLLRTMGISGQVTQEFLDIIDSAKAIGFDSQAIMFIAREIARRAYKSIGSFENEITIWAERGIMTLDKIQEYNADKESNDEDIKKLYGIMGIEGAVNQANRKIYVTLIEKGFSKEKIFEAAKDCDDMRSLKRKLTAQVKQTASHNYNSREDLNDNIFTGLDELEDE